jgi:hypothetical protein
MMDAVTLFRLQFPLVGSFACQSSSGTPLLKRNAASHAVNNRKFSKSRGKIGKIILFCVALATFCLSGVSAYGAKSGTLIASSSKVSFGSTAVGSKVTTNITLTNSSSTTMQISALSVTGSSFSATGQSALPTTINANSTYKVTIQYEPASAGTVTGQLSVTFKSSKSISASTLKISLSGTGVPVLSEISCESSTVTGAGTDTCKVTLNTTAASGGVSVKLASSNSAVTVPASVTVTSGACSASFTATVASVSTAQTANLTAIYRSTTTRFLLQLNTNTGAATLSTNSSSIAFGNIIVNTTSTQSLTLTSSGTAAVTIKSATVTGTGYSVSGITFPMTLSAGQSATLNVLFSPTATGSATGQVILTSNSSSGSSSAINLSGTGVPPVVDLSWEAPSNSSVPVTGYFVYRAASGSTSYTQLNASAIAVTSYIDNAIQSGNTYDYMVESVDSSGNTSVPSNVAIVVIP